MYDTGCVVVISTKVKGGEMISNDISILTYKYIKNDILYIMPRLQRGPEGRYHITVPIQLVKAKKWDKGEDIACLIVGPNVMPKEGDVILRPSGV